MIDPMPLSTALLETLLNMHESEILDFKREQYPFDGADNVQKSELIKDILAFANAWKTSDAHILIGVEEVKGARGNVLGVVHHIDDAKIQQLVNSKTNTPVRFSYLPVEIDSKAVGILRIDKDQERPIYLNKDFGKLKKGVVHIRRGSSTVEAEPDEVAKMGMARISSGVVLPTLELQFGNISNREAIGSRITVSPTILVDPPPPSLSDIIAEKLKPYDFEEISRKFARRSLISDVSLDNFSIKQSPEQIRNYKEQIARMVSFVLVLKNLGEIVADDVRAELICDKSNEYRIISERSYPGNQPRGPYGLLVRTPIIDHDLSISSLPEKWLIEACFGKIQPQAEAWLSDKFYLECTVETEVRLYGKIYADNLPKPIDVELFVKVFPREEIYNSTNYVNEGTENE